MGSDDVAVPVGDARDRRLEGTVLERLDPAAVVADEVVVMVAAGMRGLEPRDTVTEVDALHEPELIEPFEGAVHACEPDPAAAAPHPLVNLLRGETALLPPEELDDDAAGTAAPAARCSQARQRTLDPGLLH